MTKKAEGRGKDLPTEMPSETQRMMVRDLRDFRISGFNPFDHESYKSEKFHKFRDEYKEHGFAVFLVNVESAARITRSSMKKTEVSAAKRSAKEAEKKRKAETKKKAVETCIGSKNGNSLAKMMNVLKFDPSINITDPIVEPYPCDNKLLVLFELVGDVDDAETSNAIDFASSGDTIRHWTRVPKVWLNEQNLIDTKGKASVRSADTSILRNAIDQRKTIASELDEEDGYIWEPNKIIDLPFCCEPMLFNKHEEEIDTFLTQGNKRGYKWGYFWLIRSGHHSGALKKLVFECDEVEDEDEKMDTNSCVAGEEFESASEFSDSDEEVVDETIEEEEVVVEDASMDAESTRSQSSRSYLRNQWTEEINLRKIADNSRKAAEHQRKIVEDQLKTAEEKETAALRAQQLADEEAKKALLKAQLEKGKLHREAEEMKRQNEEKAQEHENVCKALEFLRGNPDDDHLETEKRSEVRTGGAKYKNSPCDLTQPKKRTRLGEPEPPASRRKKVHAKRPTRRSERRQEEGKTDNNPNSQQ